jgi:transposase
MVKKSTAVFLLKAQRRKFSSEFKVRVVLEALKETHSLGELAEKFDLDSNQISEWKKKFLSKAHLIFDAEDSSDFIEHQNPLSDNQIDIT